MLEAGTGHSGAGSPADGPQGAPGQTRDIAGEIAKKDILREMGISYGQFYRWKRMGLIPEAWFVRRSTFTGQEAFLPRDKVIERIQRIQELKDRYSLEEIAEMVSPDAALRTYAPAELSEMAWISPRARALAPEADPGRPAGFQELLCLTLVTRLLADGALSDDQVRLAAGTMLRRFDELGGDGAERTLTVVTRDGVTSVALHVGTCLFDEQTQVLARVDLNALIEEIKVRLQEQSTRATG